MTRVLKLKSAQPYTYAAGPASLRGDTPRFAVIFPLRVWTKYSVNINKYGPNQCQLFFSTLLIKRQSGFDRLIFRLDALALSVIATATWLAGWLSVTAGIVSKRLNVSENFFHHLIAPS